MGDADRLPDLIAVLASVAGHLGRLLREGKSLGAIGVEVVRAELVGRDGGIHDRWDRKVVLVDVGVPAERQGRIVAHEIGHLMLAYVNRSGRLRLAREDQEQLCDAFADWLLADTDARELARSGTRVSEPAT